MTNEKLREAVARVICLAAGNEPDSPCCNPLNPRHYTMWWTEFTDEADEVIATVAAALKEQT